MDSGSKIIIAVVGLFFISAQSFSQRARFGDRNASVVGEISAAPDNSNFHSWASHPFEHDIGDSIPEPLRKNYSHDGTRCILYTFYNLFAKSK